MKRKELLGTIEVYKDSKEAYLEEFRELFLYHSLLLDGVKISKDQVQSVISDNQIINPIVGYHKAFRYMLQCVKDRRLLDEQVILQIHKLVMWNGRNRNERKENFAYRVDMNPRFPFLLREFYENLNIKSKICGLPEAMNPMDLAAWTHNEFLQINPFKEGNGRIARLLLNYQLMLYGYLPVLIPVIDSKKYEKIIKEYTVNKELDTIATYVHLLEEREVDRLRLGK